MTEAAAPAVAPSAPSAPTAPSAPLADAGGRETLPDISGGRSDAARRFAAEARAAAETDPPPAPGEGDKPGEPPPAAAGDATKPSRAERRRTLLDLQREARSLSQQKRELAEARRGFSTLEEAAKSGDPDAILRALNYDPDKYQHDKLVRALKEGAAADPVADQIQAAVAPLLERLRQYEDGAKTERETRAVAEHSQRMIAEHVRPLFQGEGAAKHEALLSQFETTEEAEQYVYAVGRDHFEKTGEIKEPAAVARMLDDHVMAEYEKDLEKKRKLSRLAPKFAPPPGPKRTLTNDKTPPPAGDLRRFLNPLGTREQQNAEALAAARAKASAG